MMDKIICGLCGSDEISPISNIVDFRSMTFIIDCDDCLVNWAVNGKNCLSGRLQIGNKKEEINQKAN